MRCYVCPKRFTASDKVKFSGNDRPYCIEHDPDYKPDPPIPESMVAHLKKELGLPV